MDISDWRVKIDSVDQRLVELLNERARYVLEIGAMKRSLKLPVYEPRREVEIMENIRRWNTGPPDTEAVKPVFEPIQDQGPPNPPGALTVSRER